MSYYSPYFNELGTVHSLSQNAFNKFTSDVNELTQLEAGITLYKNKAEQALSFAHTAYYNSTTWARVGNSYENDRNYNIYLDDLKIYNQDIDAMNSKIDSYNQVLTEYNTLVTEYNGTQPAKSIQEVQAQSAN